MGPAAIKVLRWAIFGVVVSLIPLGYSYTILVIKSQPATWAKILGNGELLIIVWALCAGAIGELFGSGPEYTLPKILSGGFTLIILIFSTLLFASVAEARVSGTTLDEASLLVTSLVLLASGFVSCAFCMALSEY